MACKSKRDITGLYYLEESGYRVIKLNADSTFQFEDNDIKKYNFDTQQPKNANEPNRFAASGIWHRINKDSIILNSVSRRQDTSDYWTIIKQPNKNGNFKFTFKALSGNIMSVFQVAKVPDFKYYIAMRLHGGFDHFEIEPEKFDTLYFNDGHKNLLYPFWSFVKGNNLPAHYIMTLKPPHVNGYFKNKIVAIKGKKITFSKDSVYKKFTPYQ
ncbi:hypothetical protein IM792_10600 [Mucilaginibacter sp. JRF]|uniref:hypothetical protein n=1 Tax=Mucilaginibacter sp. JRF TaxID=2780088 RepID=UPI0018800117|nr:hypothetical protein [Mucilaginibacter sp. JRF]MBE9584897.1 hypothetical protein [Mucilaginibacter sp. JRF]